MIHAPLLTFMVVGKPQPRGSKATGRRKDGGTFVRDDNPASYAWMGLIRDRAQVAMDEIRSLPVRSPIRLDVAFYMERPKNHFAREGLTVRGLSMPRPTVKPDRGKYLRAVEDALTGVVYEDDSQVVDGRVSKHYGAPARAVIAVYILGGASSLDDYVLTPANAGSPVIEQGGLT